MGVETRKGIVNMELALTQYVMTPGWLLWGSAEYDPVLSDHEVQKGQAQ